MPLYRYSEWCQRNDVLYPFTLVTLLIATCILFMNIISLLAYYLCFLPWKTKSKHSDLMIFPRQNAALSHILLFPDWILYISTTYPLLRKARDFLLD
jgi:hypothetical protein